MTTTAQALRLPGLQLPDDLAAFRRGVQEFLRAEMAPERTRGHRDRRDLTGWDEPFERAFLGRAGAAGLLGVSLPVAYGGGGHPRSWQAVVTFEAAYHDAPMIDTAAALVAPSVLTFGTDAQRDRFVRAAVDGSTIACIAYTEADAGSDLANISTSARDSRKRFVLDGEKALVTAAHKADWCATIARTDPSSRGSRGLSMFLVDMHTDGVIVERVPTANGWTLGTVRFEHAAVPADALLGERDNGWRQLGAALLSERSGMAWFGWATRNLEVLVDVARGTADARVRDALADLATRLFTGLRLAQRVLALQDAGQAPAVEAAMTKVLATELLQRIARVGDRLLGPGVLVAPGWFGEMPVSSWFGYETVERLHPTLSVGTNEIQRTTIAQVGLGLPS